MEKLLAQIMLLADYDNVGWGDRLKYIWNAILHFAPIALVLDLFNWWWSDNHQFGQFMCIALIANLVIGAYMHKKSGTFCFKQFIVKNAELAFIISVTYLMLEMLRYTAGTTGFTAKNNYNYSSELSFTLDNQENIYLAMGDDTAVEGYRPGFNLIEIIKN